MWRMEFNADDGASDKGTIMLWEKEIIMPNEIGQSLLVFTSSL